MPPLRPTLLAAATVLTLAACQQETPVQQEPAADTTPPAATDSTPPPATADSTALDAQPASQLPAAMQGRWGLVPADCEPGRADAKGLLVIAPRRLEFYESAATLTDISESTPGRIRASFDFTGEGMSWQRDMTLAVGDDGRTLVRREFGEDAATEPLNYTKC
jgi:predicted small lipoprotein YifL